LIRLLNKYAALNAIIFLTATANRPVGASTSYPYPADLITGKIFYRKN